MKSPGKRLKARIKAFAIKRLTPDYEEIKSENEKLKRDIYNLIRRKNKIEGVTTKMEWEVKFQIEENMWFGSSSISKKTKNEQL